MREVRNGLRIAGMFSLAFSAGAGAMYLFDPHRGRKRRAKLRDKAYRFARQSEHIVEKAGRDFRNRAVGAIHETRSMLRHEDVADIKLIGRVRAKLGRVTSHPHAIVVSAEQGRVTLEGVIWKEELARTLDGVRRIEGVKEIDNRLAAHDGSTPHPALEGGRQRRGERPAIFKSNWAPALRMGACLTGAATVVWGMLSSKKIAKAAAAVGVLMLARGITNREASRRSKELIRS